MEAQWFTAGFFLQLIMAIAAAGAVYGAIRVHLHFIELGLTEEKRLREEHVKQDLDSFHSVNTEISRVNQRISLVEGKVQVNGVPK